MRPAALVISHCDKVSVRWSQRHEYPEDDNADHCHQDNVAVSFHYQCLLYIEALMAMPAMPSMVPAMT
jgi:hypothetical protein